MQKRSAAGWVWDFKMKNMQSTEWAGDGDDDDDDGVHAVCAWALTLADWLSDQFLRVLDCKCNLMVFAVPCKKKKQLFRSANERKQPQPKERN